MTSFLERLSDAIISFASLLFAAAVTKKTRPKRAAARAARKRAPAAKKRARPTTPKKAARSRKSAGRPPARAAPPAKTPTAPPAHPSPPKPKPAPPTGRAILLSPENNKFADSRYPKFRWLSVGGATRYEVAWSESPDFSDSFTIVSIATEATVPAQEPLSVGLTYYWRVRGGNESGWGPWSPAASFQVLEEPPAS